MFSGIFHWYFQSFRGPLECFIILSFSLRMTRNRTGVFFFYMWIPSFSRSLVRKLLSLTQNFTPFLRMRWPLLCAFISVTNVLLHWYTCQFLFQYHSGFVAMALWCFKIAYCLLHSCSSVLLGALRSFVTLPPSSMETTISIWRLDINTSFIIRVSLFYLGSLYMLASFCQLDTARDTWQGILIEERPPSDSPIRKWYFLDCWLMRESLDYWIMWPLSRWPRKV